jgi:hypothetical protein
MKRIAGGAAFAAGLILVTGFSDPDRILTTSYTSPLFDLPAAAFQDDDCAFCRQCAAGWHALESGDWEPDRRHGEPDHDCDPGWCSVAHPESPSCTGGIAGLDDEAKDQLWTLITNGEAEGLSSAFAAFGELIEYNAVRQAVQARGCDGNIVLSIPLTAAQVRRLTE